ncbi:uncharacterized protein [Littorina saxatilis]|uniref:Uncharacterized protein n=1 Tax=Littorina saxatilis TaxID=31220 RepID=A0AAN9GCI7_9CAEN
MNVQGSTTDTASLRVMTAAQQLEAFQAQLDEFPHTFHLQDMDQLRRDKLERLEIGLQSALLVGYKTGLETARGRNFLAYTLHRLGRDEDSLKELDKVLSLVGQQDNLVSLANKAVIMWVCGDRPGAQDIAESLYAIRKTSTDFPYLVTKAQAELAFSYTRLGPDFFPLAIATFSEVIPKAQGSEKWLWQFGLAMTKRRSIRASPESSLMESRSGVSERLELLDQFLEIAKYSDSDNLKAKVFSEVALLLNSFKSTSKEDDLPMTPVEACEKALELDEKDNSVLCKCGQIFRYVRQTERSCEVLKNALGIRPSARGYHQLGSTFKALATQEKYKDRKVTSPRSPTCSTDDNKLDIKSADDDHHTQSMGDSTKACGPGYKSSGNGRSIPTINTTEKSPTCFDTCKNTVSDVIMHAGLQLTGSKSTRLAASESDDSGFASAESGSRVFPLKEATGDLRFDSEENNDPRFAIDRNQSSLLADEIKTCTGSSSQESQDANLATDENRAKVFVGEQNKGPRLASEGDKGLGHASEKDKGLGHVSEEEDGLRLAYEEDTGQGHTSEESKGLGLATSQGDKGKGHASEEDTGQGHASEESKGLGLDSHEDKTKGHASEKNKEQGLASEENEGPCLSSKENKGQGVVSEESKSLGLAGVENKGPGHRKSLAVVSEESGDPMLARKENKEIQSLSNENDGLKFDTNESRCPWLSPNKEVRALQKAVKSPPKGTTTFTREDKFVQQTLYYLELSVKFSKNANTRAMYDLALMHKSLGELDQSRKYLQLMLSKEQILLPLERINVYEQIGLVAGEMAESKSDPGAKYKLNQESHSMLMMALKIASRTFSASSKLQIKEIWQSFTTLLAAVVKSDNDKSKKMREEATLLQLVKHYKPSLALLQELEQMDPKQIDDPEHLRLFVEVYVGTGDFQAASTCLDLMKCTLQSAKTLQLFEDKHYVVKVFVRAARQALLEELPSAKGHFGSAFKDAIPIASEKSSSSKGTDAPNPDNKTTWKKPWDIMILHEDSGDTRTMAMALTKIFSDVYGLRVPIMDRDLPPNRLELEGILDMMEQSTLVVIPAGTQVSDLRQHCISHSALRSPASVVTLLADGEHVPKLLRTRDHRAVRCPKELLGVTLGDSGTCQQHDVDLLCTFFCSLINIEQDFDHDGESGAYVPLV